MPIIIFDIVLVCILISVIGTFRNSTRSRSNGNETRLIEVVHKYEAVNKTNEETIARLMGVIESYEKANASLLETISVYEAIHQHKQDTAAVWRGGKL